MTPNEEKQFNKEFYPFIAYRCSNQLIDINTSPENNADISMAQLEHCEKQIKQFITSLLEARERELVSKITKMKCRSCVDGLENPPCQENRLLDKVLKLLN